MLGEVIKAARERKGLTQIALAYELSNKLELKPGEVISSSYISEIEISKNLRPDKERLKALAEILDLPYASVVTGLEVSEDLKNATAKRETEGGIQEIIEIKLPAVIAAQKGLNEPRYASLPGIMKAKKKPIKEINLATLGMDANEVGEKGSRLKTMNYSLPPERKAGKKVEGEPKEIVAQLVTWLHTEAKSI